MNFVPTIIEVNHEGERHYDVYSLLLKDRIIMLNGEIDDTMACNITAQLLYLASKDPHKDISLYINSVGGSITSGMAIYDTMQHISCDVSTICIGLCASMGAFLLAGGTKGKRYSLPNSEIMIHQPSGGAQGMASDIDIAAKRILRLKKRLNTILAENTQKTLIEIEKDTERDYFMSAEEALEYGLIDKIIYNNEKKAVTIEK